MFGFTHQLRITGGNGLNVTFQGYTLAEFQTRYVDTQDPEGGPHGRHSKYTRVMNNDLMDLAAPEVQRALDQSFDYARSAATAAARYFSKRPGRFHSYARQQKIFARHFKLDNPSNDQRDEVERVLRATATGLNNPLVISDLFAAKDGQHDAGLVDGAEGQVVFSPDEDVAYMADLRDPANADRVADVTRDHLSQAADAQIFIAYTNMKFWNKVQMARVIIHEATHKFAYTGDYAYHSHGNDWDTLTGADAIKNADSYAYAAVSVKANHALNPAKITNQSNRLLSLHELRRIVPSMRG